MLGDPETFGGLFARVRLYENPLDPSRGIANSIAGSGEIDRLGVCSYPWNAQALGVQPTLSTATDGLSQTIWIAEHYAWNCGGTAFLSEGGMGSIWAAQPATFAHGGTIPGRPAPGDYVPITSGDPPVSRAADGKTFQVRPQVAECDPRLPNATSSRGLQVAFGDGSVRILGPAIAPEVFWSAVTPRVASCWRFPDMDIAGSKQRFPQPFTGDRPHFASRIGSEDAARFSLRWDPRAAL
jgi:hypothetical protein